MRSADAQDAGNPDGGAPLYRRGEGLQRHLPHSRARCCPVTARPAHTLHASQARFKNTRFPVGGIKSPPDGVIHVTPGDFVDACGKSTTNSWTMRGTMNRFLFFKAGPAGQRPSALAR